MTSKKGYVERMKFKNYDRNKHKNVEKRMQNHFRNEVRTAQMIKEFEEDIKELMYED